MLGERAHRARRRTTRSGSTPRRGTATVQWLAVQAERLGLGGPHDPPARPPLHAGVGRGRQAQRQAIPNTDEDWTWLVDARGQGGALARLSPVRADLDARNAEPVIRARAEVRSCRPQPYISVGLDVTVPDADDLEPSCRRRRLPGDQPFKLVFFGEKTIARATCSARSRGDCGADLYLPAGEISDTMLHQMAKVGAEDGRPMVVLCFCDCDPAGWQMPISIGAQAAGVQGAAVPRARLPGAPGRAHARAGPGVWLAVNPAEGDRAPGRPLAGRRWASSRPRSTRWPPCSPICCGRSPARRSGRSSTRPCTSAAAKAKREWREACQKAIDAQTDQDRLDASARRGRARCSRPCRPRSSVSTENSRSTRPPTSCRAPTIPQPVIAAEPDWLAIDRSRPGHGRSSPGG